LLLLLLAPWSGRDLEMLPQDTSRLVMEGALTRFWSTPLSPVKIGR
jgi:hypothetical protein